MIPEGVGYQVHRSHWVAFRGISSVRKEGRNRIITFDDGVEIPVARHRLARGSKSTSRQRSRCWQTPAPGSARTDRGTAGP